MRFPAITLSMLVPVAVSACIPSELSAPPSLEPKLPEYEREAIRFFQGDVGFPDSVYAFQLTPNRIFVVDPDLDDDGSRFKGEITVAECPGLEGQHRRLLEAVVTTMRIASGEISAPEPYAYGMDPGWRLEYWSPRANTHVELRGRDDQRFGTPWIDMAMDIRETAADCIGAS